MPTCGYTCPQCEGRSYTDDGAVCDWCSEVEVKKEEVQTDEKPINDSDDDEKVL